jgi:putative ABC transport system permease protein
MAMIWQDIRHGMRVLSKNRGFTAVAIFVTALGIGANTAIFSVVNAVLLRPLPYEHAERLVRVMSTNAKQGTINRSHSFPNFADYRAQNDVFEAMVAYNDTSATLSDGDSPERIKGVEASVDLFNVLDVKPILGRVFAPEDEQPGGSPAVVISYGMWQRRFSADVNVAGRQITLDSKPKTIIGVLPANFQFVFVNEPMTYYVPLDPAGGMEKQRGAGVYHVLARLKAGVTIEQAEPEMQSIAARIEQQYTEQTAGESVSLLSAHTDLVGDLRPTLLVLLGAVGFVLLIACANVANLQLARATRRGREMAIRVALGASRWRVVRQLLTESLALSLLGGALGLLVALWGVDLISAFIPADIPRFKETGLDPTVLGFTLIASVLTGVLFGLAPALQLSRINLNEALKEGGRSATEGHSRHRLRSALIVSEVALSLVLLVGAGLLIKSFLRLRNTDPGFNSQQVLTASISLPEARYPKDEQQSKLYQQAIERIARVPGVEAAGAILPLPLSDSSISTSFTVDGQPDPGPGARPFANARIVTPNYIRAMGIPLVSGRDFNELDAADAPKVILINETLAREFFAGEDPLGKRLSLGLNSLRGEIVGVVGDVRHRSLDHKSGPEYYVTYKQVPVDFMSVVVRARTSDPTGLAASLRDVVHEIDKDLPLYRIRPMNDLVADSLARQRFSMTLIIAFAGLALALAGAGIFAVMTFLISQRTHEIGVRMALGARPGNILTMVMRQGMGVTLIGVGLGLSVAFAITRVMQSLLYQVSATDPATFVLVPLMLTGVALGACFVPARRATKVDPMVALRYE